MSEVNKESAKNLRSIVGKVIKVEAKAVWMQEGVITEKTAAQIRETGLLVVTEKCILKEH